MQIKPSPILKTFWQKQGISFNAIAWVTVFALGIPRFILVLSAQLTQAYGAVMIIFLLMWLAPFVFLNKAGRQAIGMVKPKSSLGLLYSFLLGTAVCLSGYMVSKWFYHDSMQNWLIYMSSAYKVPSQALQGSGRHLYFLIYAITAMTFSPVGEELFYRGIVQEGFKEKMGAVKASNLDSLVFALTHLAHFGIVYVGGAWQLFWMPALLWMVFMFLSSKVFFWCKERSGSLWGAISCHAGFNCCMMYLVFYQIFK